MCLELVLNNDIQKTNSSNDLKFDMFVYYTCVNFWEKNSKLGFYLFHLNKV